MLHSIHPGSHLSTRSRLPSPSPPLLLLWYQQVILAGNVHAVKGFNLLDAQAQQAGVFFASHQADALEDMTKPLDTRASRRLIYARKSPITLSTSYKQQAMSATTEQYPKRGAGSCCLTYQGCIRRAHKQAGAKANNMQCAVNSEPNPVHTFFSLTVMAG